MLSPKQTWQYTDPLEDYRPLGKQACTSMFARGEGILRSSQPKKGWYSWFHLEPLSFNMVGFILDHFRLGSLWHVKNERAREGNRKRGARAGASHPARFQDGPVPRLLAGSPPAGAPQRSPCRVAGCYIPWMVANSTSHHLRMPWLQPLCLFGICRRIESFQGFFGGAKWVLSIHSGGPGV